MNITQTPLYNLSTIRAMELAIFSKTKSFNVMKQAGIALAHYIIDDLNNQKKHNVIVFLGVGNNAGDALIAATYLHDKGFSVCIISVLNDDYHGDTYIAYEKALQSNLTFHSFKDKLTLNSNDVVIDGLLGIGLNRPISGQLAKTIHLINEANVYRVYAVDVPSGIDINTGNQLGECSITASDTITFIASKVGLHTGLGKFQSGRVSIKAPVNNYLTEYELSNIIKSDTYLITEIKNKPLQSDFHKGKFGHALLVGSGKNSNGIGMFGAGVLAAISSLKVGVGKSSLFSHPDYHQQFIDNQTPLYEVMKCHSFSCLENYSAIGVGMGLGKGPWGKQQFLTLIDELKQKKLKLPVLIDADGLFHLKQLKQENINFSPSVITPHEAEAADLLSIPITKLVSDKPYYVKQLAKQYKCIALLKGSGTLISDGTTTWINSSGNVALATAGTGDVLSGMIVGLMARGDDFLIATQKATHWHGLAADYYQKKSHLCDKSMMASDIWQYL